MSDPMTNEQIAEIAAGPCPLRWCQSRAVKVERYRLNRKKSLFTVVCECCGLRSPQHSSAVKAVRQWNGEGSMMISGVRHWSDCSTHNQPALANTHCDCGGATEDDCLAVRDYLERNGK